MATPDAKPATPKKEKSLLEKLFWGGVIIYTAKELTKGGK